MRTCLYRNVNASNHRFFAWAVTLTAGLLFFYEFFQLNSMNALSTPLMRDFHLTGTQLSHLSICYFISNASLVFFAGNLLDRHPARYVTLFATTVCILGIALFASSHSLTGLMVARFLIGIGGAFCFISGMKVASRWFEPKHLALATGVAGHDGDGRWHLGASTAYGTDPTPGLAPCTLGGCGGGLRHPVAHVALDSRQPASPRLRKKSKSSTERRRPDAQHHAGLTQPSKLAGSRLYLHA